MPNLNKAMLMGHTGRDAEMRYLSTGTAKSDFTLAVNNRRRNANGEWEDVPDWFNIVIFGDQAERISQYITKGKALFVEGRIQTRKWEDDDGNKRERTEIVAFNIEFLGGGQSQGQSRQRDDLDDLPFD